MEKNLKNKSVLITGINGFIGKALAQKLRSLGANVFGISRSKSEDLNVITGNITDFDLLEEVIKDKNITICFHLAGESIVEEGQKSPYITFKTNIEGTLNILEIARKHKLEKIIIASSSHVYGKNKLPYYEGYSARPSRPYETSKACTDLIAQSYADTYSLPVLIPRFVNIYGPGDTNFSRLIPKTIKAVLEKRSPEMWEGSAVRDYLYIDDAVAAYISLASVDIQEVGKNRVFNFGTGKTISVKELIEKIITLSKSNVSITKVDSLRQGEISAQYVATVKARRLLRWKATTDLQNGLRESISWYRKYLEQ